MQSVKKTITGILGVGIVYFSMIASSTAFPFLAPYNDLQGGCDQHGDRQLTDELGTGFLYATLFPDELIAATSRPTQAVACAANDTAAPNVEVDITNLTDRDITNLWYVADFETAISNFDGVAAGIHLAFRIDVAGANTPLIGRDVDGDLIFEPGETWTFVIDDYFNGFGYAAHSFDSLGISDGDFAGLSSGNIFVGEAPDRIPVPATAWLLGLAGVCLWRNNRKSKTNNT